MPPGADNQAQLGPFIHGQTSDIPVIEKNLSFVGFDQPDHHIKSRRFTRSVWSKQTNDFTLFHIHGNMVNYCTIMVTFNEIVCMNGETQDLKISTKIPEECVIGSF